MSFVVDASVAMAWCFEDESSPFTDGVLDLLREDQALVPSIWPLEVANVLLVAERRGLINQAQTLRYAQLMRSLPILVDAGSLSCALGSILALGRDCGLSSYDAAYLELAMRHGLPLATKDSRLIFAAKQLGVAALES